MSFKNQSVFSSTYTNTTFTVTEGMGISSITINLVSGSATLLGGLGIPGLTNSSVALTAGQPVVLNVNRGYTLEGITVDSTAGGVFQVFTIYDYINSPDPSATAFLAATGTTGAVQSAAIDTLVKSLKAYNLWPYMKAIYPFVTDNYNFLSYTADFGNGLWLKQNVSVTTNSVIAPDGTLTADTLDEGSTLNFHNMRQIPPSLPATNIVFSCSIKKNTASYIRLILSSGSSSVWTAAQFDLDTLTYTGGAGTGATGSFVTASITAETNGFYRCQIVSSLSGTNITNAWFALSDGSPIVNTNDFGRVFYQGTNKSVYIWGAQVESGSSATTYQPILTTQQAYITNQFKYNLVNPVDSDAAFRLVFNGGWTFSSNGALPNGTNGFANTYLNPFLAMSGYSQHLSMYSRTQNTSVNGANIGSYVAASNSELNLFQYYASVSLKGGSVYEYPTYAATFNNTNTLGFQVVSRTSNNALKLHFNGSVLATNTNTETKTRPNLNMYLGASNWSTLGATQFTPHQNAFTSIGDGLTDAQSYNLARIVYAYETALSRQVGVPIVSDPDAQNFINAADITDLTQANAINNLVIGLKADGLWTKMKAIYPFVGGTASTHKWNLKDPRDLDAAYRLVFNGGWTHSSTGATPNGTNGFADTKLNWDLNTSLNDVSFGCYWRNNVQAITGGYYGVVGGGAYVLIRDRVSCDFYVNDNGTGTIATLSKGLHLATRKNSTQQTLYVNGSGTAQSRNSLSKPNLNFYFGGSNNFTSYTNNQIALALISDGLTDTEAANLYTQVQTYQTALSRQV